MVLIELPDPLANSREQITTSMSEKELAVTTIQAIDAVPPGAGSPIVQIAALEVKMKAVTTYLVASAGTDDDAWKALQNLLSELQER